MPSFFDRIQGGQDNSFSSPFRRVSFEPDAQIGGMGGYRNFAFPIQQDEPVDPVVKQQTDPFAGFTNPFRGKAAQAYQEHLGNLPVSSDYEPSKGRRLGAALTAAAAAFGRNPRATEMGSNIRDSAYRGAMQDWSLRGAGLKEQADIEKQDIAGQMEYAKFLRDTAGKDRDYNLNLFKAISDARVGDSTIAYRQAQIDNFRQQGWEETTDAEGNTVFRNPRTKEVWNAGPSIETTKIGQKNRELTDAERRTGILGYEAQSGRMNAVTNQGQLGVGQTNAATNIQNANTRAAEVAAQIPINQQNANANTTRAQATGYVDQQQQYAAQSRAIENVLQAHPQWKNWVTSDDKTGYQVRSPKSYWGNYDPTKDANYKTFLDAIEAERNRLLSVRRPIGGVTIPPPVGAGPIDFDKLPE